MIFLKKTTTAGRMRLRKGELPPIAHDTSSPQYSSSALKQKIRMKCSLYIGGRAKRILLVLLLKNIFNKIYCIAYFHLYRGKNGTDKNMGNLP